MTREIPIIMSTMMVQALLEGRKTQTRRVIKNHTAQHWNKDEMEGIYHDYKEWHNEDTGKTEPPEWLLLNEDGDIEDVLGQCRYGNPGDILWVRETFQRVIDLETNEEYVRYAADNPEPLYLTDGDGFQEYYKNGSERFIPFKPSIHMPKEAARIWLKVKSVRIERLQLISPDDAIAEGIQSAECNPEERSKCTSTLCKNQCDAKGTYYNYPTDFEDDPCYSAVESFEQLWKMINGKESLESNPFVWVIEFEVLSTTGKPETI